MPTTSAVRPIVERFIERLDEVVERCSTTIMEVVPAYGRLDEGFKDDLEHAVRENVGALAQTLSQGRDIRREELESIQRTGARRAEQSIPLDDVLHAYRTVSRVCWDVLADECRNQEGDPLEATIALAEALLRYTDEISGSVAEAYSRAQRALVREQEGARREFLADLLYRTDAPAEDVLRRAHSFGYDLSLGYLALVGRGPGEDSKKEGLVQVASTRIVPEGSPEPIVMQKGEHTIVLMPTDPSFDVLMVPEKLVVELGGPWTFGSGGPDPGLEGIRRAYLEAREALEIGLALGSSGPIYRFDDLLPYHFLRAEPALIDRFINQTLGSLIEYDDRRNGDLIKTIEAYFACDGSVKMAGESLFAHPHTITYRLKQIEKLTGWSLRDPEDKLRLQLALRAYRLAAVRRESEAD
ncbi:MAG: helix-turn-helix domain-containing protein [Actinobacteria bacterium]|nr:helix-turn-helix domain-containing protein [Actinomycetota bacterium]